MRSANITCSFAAAAAAKTECGATNGYVRISQALPRSGLYALSLPDRFLLRALYHIHIVQPPWN